MPRSPPQPLVARCKARVSAAEKSPDPSSDLDRRRAIDPINAMDSHGLLGGAVRGKSHVDPCPCRALVTSVAKVWWPWVGVHKNFWPLGLKGSET